MLHNVERMCSATSEERTVVPCASTHIVHNRCWKNGKPLEREGRKAFGLRDWSYDGRVAQAIDLERYAPFCWRRLPYDRTDNPGLVVAGPIAGCQLSLLVGARV
jgi:hypothetical protein